MIRYLTSREFNQDTGRAKREAESGPVFITDRGEPSHVLLSIAEFHRLMRKSDNIGDRLWMPGAEDIELEIPARKSRGRQVDLD